MFKALRDLKKRVYQYRTRESVHRELDSILSAAAEQETLEDKLHWLVQLLQWIRFEGHVDIHLEREVGRLQIARLRFFLMVLDKKPEWKLAVAKNLRAIVKKVSGLELYTETGLPKEVGIWSEFSDRLMLKILPSPPLDHELTYLFWALFPNKEDVVWVASIDEKTFEDLVTLFNYEVSPNEGDWNRMQDDLLDALDYLVIQIRATGLGPAVRKRLDKNDFRESAFFHLDESLNGFHKAFREGRREEALSFASRLRMTVWECKRELAQVTKHLDEFGVSVSLVFQMASLRTYLARVDSLLEILINERVESRKVTSFLSKLIEETQDLRSISTLFAQNISLLARKVVERAAETGEHYITRTKAEYNHLVRAAAGGGAITSLTVYMKVFILSLGLSNFGEGIGAALNYSISFVAIQLLGFTLGTKQPAMTAPALAAKMSDVDTEKGMKSLVDDIVYIIRSQVAAVTGNVLLVVPCAILIDAFYFLMSGTHILSEKNALYAFKSTDIVGPAVLYAGVTGILLWASSIIAGWVDNWFALNSLGRTLRRSPPLLAILGQRATKRIVYFLEHNISGLAGNISLGFLLGMFPEIMKFLGVPLDIRHVTLSSGSLGAALPVLGLDFLRTPEFWRAVVGVIFIGFFNVMVSFSMALWIAVRARGIRPRQQLAIRSAVLQRLRSQPFTFLFPISKLGSGSADSPGNDKTKH